MQNVDEIFEKISKVGDGIAEKRKELIEADITAGFTYTTSAGIIDVHVKNMRNFRTALKYIGNRKGICGKDEWTALVFPFNVTLGACGPIACQMLVGNNLMVKPSPISIKTYQILESIWTRYFPDNVRFDYGDAQQFMTSAIKDPKVKVIGAYGTDAVAMKYKDLVKQYGKTYFFEGPGKNPAIVLNDANPDDAAKQLVGLRFLMNAGQVCLSPGRFYIHEDVFERFSKNMIELLKGAVVVGDPNDSKTNIGFMGSERAVAAITEQLKDAVSKGAKIICGGKIEGKMVPPTVITNVNHQMIGMREESFGPVAWLMSFKTTDEAIKLAKDNKYGLGATIFGVKDAQKVKSALKGEDYLHYVDDFVFGKFGIVETDVARLFGDPDFAERMEYGPMGGYGYSGWVWKTVDGKFRMMQGPKSFAIETSVKLE